MIPRKNILLRVYWKMQRLPLAWFILVELIAMYVGSELLSRVGIAAEDAELESNLITTGILAVFFAPLVETFAFQLLPIELSQLLFRNKFKKRFYLLSIFISTALFSLIHCYNWQYMVVAFWVGFVFAFGYITQMHKGYWKAFLPIFLVHTIWNAIATILSFIQQ